MLSWAFLEDPTPPSKVPQTENRSRTKSASRADSRRSRQALPERHLRAESSQPLGVAGRDDLSAQCTDKRVNEVTPGLFKKYPTIADFAHANQDELANDIRSTGFFNNKVEERHRRRQADSCRLRRQGAAQHGRSAHRPGRGAQDRQRRARHRLRHRIRRCRRHARVPDFAAAGPSRARRSREDGAGPDEDHSRRSAGFSSRTRSFIMGAPSAWRESRDASIACSIRSATQRTKRYEHHDELHRGSAAAFAAELFGAPTRREDAESGAREAGDVALREAKKLKATLLRHPHQSLSRSERLACA